MVSNYYLDKYNCIRWSWICWLGFLQYGKQGGVVAVVGDREVSVEEYQQEYSNLYDQYSRMFGSMFNNELAEQLKLKDIAYDKFYKKFNFILC